MMGQWAMQQSAAHNGATGDTMGHSAWQRDRRQDGQQRMVVQWATQWAAAGSNAQQCNR